MLKHDTTRKKGHFGDGKSPNRYLTKDLKYQATGSYETGDYITGCGFDAKAHLMVPKEHQGQADHSVGPFQELHDYKLSDEWMAKLLDTVKDKKRKNEDIRDFFNIDWDKSNPTSLTNLAMSCQGFDCGEQSIPNLLKDLMPIIPEPLRKYEMDAYFWKTHVDGEILMHADRAHTRCVALYVPIYPDIEGFTPIRFHPDGNIARGFDGMNGERGTMYLWNPKYIHSVDNRGATEARINLQIHLTNATYESALDDLYPNGIPEHQVSEYEEEYDLLP